MKYLKFFLGIILSVFFCVFIGYILLPKGYLFLLLLEKRGIKVYAERVKEDFFGFRLYNVVFDISPFLKRYRRNLGKLSIFLKGKSRELKFSEVCFSGNEFFISCKGGGFLKIFYHPFKEINVIAKDFYGSCAGRSEIEKISGKFTYSYPRNIVGKLKVEGIQFFPGFSNVLIFFKKDKIVIKGSNFEQIFSF